MNQKLNHIKLTLQKVKETQIFEQFCIHLFFVLRTFAYSSDETNTV